MPTIISVVDFLKANAPGVMIVMFIVFIIVCAVDHYLSNKD